MERFQTPFYWTLGSNTSARPNGVNREVGYNAHLAVNHNEESSVGGWVGAEGLGWLPWRQHRWLADVCCRSTIYVATPWRRWMGKLLPSATRRGDDWGRALVSVICHVRCLLMVWGRWRKSFRSANKEIALPGLVLLIGRRDFGFDWTGKH